MMNSLASMKEKYGIFLILIVMFIACSLISPNFLTARNISNVSKQISISTIVAFGQTMLIISGMLDLAVGSVMALSGILSVLFFKATGMLVLSLILGMVIGVVTSMISGLAVTKFKVPPFIATLGMLTAVRGIALMTTNGQNVYQVGDFVVFGQTTIFGLPTPVWFMIVIGIVTWYLLNHTKFGRYLYAIGGNEEAARVSGLRIERVKMMAYMVSGLFTGLAGVLFMSRVNAGLPNAGIGFELDTLSIAVIGGTSMTGGIGSASGTLAGSFILGFLSNIMNLMAVPSYVQQVVKGLIIVAAVAYDVKSKTKKIGKKGSTAKKAQ